MKLRKEIRKLIPNRIYTAGIDRTLIALFKQWALEMVGEDEEMLDMGVGNEDYWVEENEQRRLRNQLRENIRIGIANT